MAEQTTQDYNWKNKGLEKLANAAPSFSYRKGLLDRFGEWFENHTTIPIRTGYDKAMDEFENTEQMRLEQLRELDQQMFYDSASEQAGRMNEAGLNPDLTGGITPGEAGEYDNQANEAPGKNIADDVNMLSKGLDMITSFTGGVITAISSAVAMVQQLGGIYNANADLRRKVYDEVGETINGHQSWDDAGMQFTNDYYNRTSKLLPTENEGEIPGVELTETSWDEFNNNPKVRLKWGTVKERRWAYQFYKDLLSSLDQDTKGKKSVTENRQASAALGQSLADETQNSVGAAEQFYKDVIPHIREIQKVTAEINNAFYNKVKQLGGAEKSAVAKYRRDSFTSSYLGGLDVQQMLDTENLQNKRNWQYLYSANYTLAGINQDLREQIFNENVDATLKVNRLYNNLISKELVRMQQLEDDPVLLGIHMHFLQTLTSGKMGSMSVLQGMGAGVNMLNSAAKGIGNAMGGDSSITSGVSMTDYIPQPGYGYSIP